MTRVRFVRNPLLVAALLPAASFAASAGDFDPSFGANGRVSLSLSTSTDALYSIEIDPLGRIVGAGHSRDGADDVAVIRLLADGAPDPAFGGGDGVVILPLAAGGDIAWDLAVQSDGKIVVTSRTDGPEGDDTTVLRLESDGDIDPTFGGGDGRFDHSLAPGFEAEQPIALALADDGGIYCGGYGGNAWDLWVIRLSGTGELDTTFGLDGVARINPGPASAYLRDLRLDAQGRVLLAGSYDTIGQVLVARLDPSGALDPSFGGDGIVTHDLGPGNIDTAEELRLLADGRLVVAGTIDRQAPMRDDLLVVRFESDGELDPTFGGGDGWVALDSGSTGDRGDALAIDGAGRIVVAGKSGYYVSTEGRALVARFTADGVPDPSFGGGDGFVIHDLAPNDDESLWSVQVESDGRIVAAGRSPRPGQSTGFDTVVVRLLGGCLFCDGFESGSTDSWSLASP